MTKEEITTLFNISELEYSNLIKEYDTEQVIELLDKFEVYYVKWSVSRGSKAKNDSEFINIGQDLFLVDESDGQIHDYDYFNKLFNRHLFRVASIGYRLASDGLLTHEEMPDTIISSQIEEEEADDADDKEISRKKRAQKKKQKAEKPYLDKMNKIYDVLYHWKKLFLSLYSIKTKILSNNFTSQNTLGLDRFNPMEPEENTPYQNLTMFLLGKLLENDLRRQGDQCMERVYTDNGMDTHAWKPKMEIKKFIYSQARMLENYEQWKNLSSVPSNASNVQKYLENVDDPIHFPDIIKDRKLFSFKNGIYETDIIDKNTHTHSDRWYPHILKSDVEPGVFVSADIPSDRSACKYFDHDFPVKEVHKDPEDWYAIETPHLQSIFDYQKFPEDVCRWFYVFLGRLLYDVNDLDGWQIMPFLKGKAKTGKSTILTGVCKLFYHQLDVGVLSNNCEKQFGLSSLEDKLMFIAPEIKENIGLEQTEFQSIISGEDTNVARKYKTAKGIVWKTPGIIAGNSPPGYKDNQGSISRRLVIFEFGRKVQKGDMRLSHKLKDEIPLIILKCNRAYLMASNKHGSSDIWSVLPEYFNETQRMMNEQINSLINFLNSDQVKYKEDFYCSKKKFSRSFKDFCKENSLSFSRFTKDFYTGPFEDRGLKVKNTKKMDRDENKMRRLDWVLGVCISDEVDDSEFGASQSEIDNLY